jgi:hypothetical protein
MRIPRKRILLAQKLLAELKPIKYSHFRDIYQNIDHTNFQTATKTDFKRIPIVNNVHYTWNKISKVFADYIILTYESKTHSKYIVLENGDIYRLSNHWGAVSTCEWTLEGEGELRCSVFVTGEWEIGVSNLSEFSIFRRKQPRRIDFVLNPEWQKQVSSVVSLKDELYKLRSKYIFNFMPQEVRKTIGTSYYKLVKELNS